MEEKNENARNQAKAQLESIKEMVAALECDYERLEELKEEKADLESRYIEGRDDEEIAEAAAELEKWNEENAEELAELVAAAGDCKDADEARQRIEEDALSVQVRSGWVSPGEMMPGEYLTAEEFEILLCTGGPAVKIVGDLSEHLEPESARLYYQDWLTPWEELILDSEDCAALLTYCQVFYFGA